MPDPFDVLAALIRVDRSPNLALAAQSLAAAGVPVFPCLGEGKRPLTRRGFLDARSDPEQVAAWWSRTPNANIGIPTGAASGVVVVDVDVHGPHDGRAAYQRATEAGLVDGAGLLVRTPTGGAHVYFPATPGSEQRSWQAAAAGVDFRGDGGYIIAPPSRRIIDGNVKLYEVADYITMNVNLWPFPTVLVMNQSQFDALSADQQAIITETAAGIPGFSIDILVQPSDLPQTLCDEGIKFAIANDQQLASFQQASEATITELSKDATTKGYIDQIVALRDGLGAPPDAAPLPEGCTFGN